MSLYSCDMGFMPRVDSSISVAGFQRNWWGEEGDLYNQLGLGFEWDSIEDQSGQREKRA